MGSIATSAPFDVLRDTKPEDTTLPAFMVSTTRGFLPRQEPIVSLPSEFAALESILSRMPIKTLDGTPGLLATFTLGETVLKELPDLTSAVNKYKDNLPLQNALYRDYSFLASAYLLEPCHERFLKGEGYGLGRQTLPAVISLPISRCAELAGFKPFMEYAGSYALFNYRLDDPKLGLAYDNLRLIRAFEHGLDPKSSEAGFVLVHVDMVQNSGPLVHGVVSTLDACESNDRHAFNIGLEQVVSSMTKVNKVMDGMWGKSKPGDYVSFRTFIFGITSQSMFPHGVVYEGHVRSRSSLLSFRSYALQDPTSAALYLLALNQVRDFRWRHWCFTREYILKKTSHPVATGGSPIVTWLPNQLQAVLHAMVEVWEGSGKTLGRGCEEVMDFAIQQKETLTKEVDKYCQERNVDASTGRVQ
ncbi:hypothetical protein BUE80_DR008823 [Diplocarpon rosae]|nr:hypothetical protein BUE80_DR008823 [Diplocarpon rosae]